MKPISCVLSDPEGFLWRFARTAYRVGPQTTHETHAQWVQALRHHLPGANALPTGSAHLS
jgi:hypothetical protein